MKPVYWLLVAAWVLVSIWLGWAMFDLAIENDGLRQVIDEHKRSIIALLDYARVATRCDLTPQELARELNVTIHAEGAKSSVAKLAFNAQFDKTGVIQIEIVDVGKVAVCQDR